MSDYAVARARSSANLRYNLLYTGPNIRIPLVRSSTLPDVFANVRGAHKRYEPRWPSTYARNHAYRSYETYKNTDHYGYDRSYASSYLAREPQSSISRCHYRRSQTGDRMWKKWNWDNSVQRPAVTSHITTTFRPTRPYDSRLLRLEDQYIPFSVISSIHRWH